RLVHAGVVEGQLGRRYRNLDGAGHQLQGLAGVLGEDIPLGVEVRNFAGDADRRPADIDRLNAADAAFARQQRLEERPWVLGETADVAKPRDHGATGKGSHGQLTADRSPSTAELGRPSSRTWSRSDPSTSGAPSLQP